LVFFQLLGFQPAAAFLAVHRAIGADVALVRFDSLPFQLGFAARVANHWLKRACVAVLSVVSDRKRCVAALLNRRGHKMHGRTHYC
jgi:hypothetical protein